MPAQQQDLDWTVERAHALRDGDRYEVLDGEFFVTPLPTCRHRTAVGLLHQSLLPHFASLATGGDHTCGVATDGQSHCWGSNGSNPVTAGRLGDGTPRPRNSSTATAERSGGDRRRDGGEPRSAVGGPALTFRAIRVNRAISAQASPVR